MLQTLIEAFYFMTEIFWSLSINVIDCHKFQKNTMSDIFDAEEDSNNQGESILFGTAVKYF